ncbi:hypothetical protein L1987_04078 [Smallanthus sonchifolius]|uniref:Uncharacterized protein n=1 Tax=Smallanthus sonchifolius TaxID=185202 RepID=A0ACB9KCH3_9ASTR|nr:hypothetical protein L1987_04078 [Smallanthus sonchifolius]
MCPLRIILIFLSATLAGFFVLRNIKSQSDTSDADDDSTTSASRLSPSSASTCGGQSSHKIYGAFVNGFWTCVDMASGRYLWRNLVSVSKKSD